MENYHVYCTNCKYFELLENTPSCVYMAKCEIRNPEDSMPYKYRPQFESSYKLNRKQIYVSGLIMEIFNLRKVLIAMDNGEIEHDYKTISKMDALNFELDKVKSLNDLCI